MVVGNPYIIKSFVSKYLSRYLREVGSFLYFEARVFEIGVCFRGHVGAYYVEEPSYLSSASGVGSTLGCQCLPDCGERCCAFDVW